MTNRQDQRNADQSPAAIPSARSIAGGAVLSAAVVASTLYIGAGVRSWWDFMIFMFGAFSCVLMLGHTGSLVVRRAVAGLETREGELEEAARAPDEIGTWAAGPRAPGAVLRVRWSYETGSYWIQGWVSDNWQVGGELEWTDTVTLARLIAEAEIDGLLPADDPATTRIRSVLGVDMIDVRIRDLGIWPR